MKEKKMEDAKNTLFEFFKEMYQWNIHSSAIFSQSSYKIVAQKNLDVITNKYCTDKLKKRATLDCSDLPEYEISKIHIEQIDIPTRSRVIIYVKVKRIHEYLYRYTLLLKNNIWLVDKKEYFTTSEQKWLNDYL